MTGIERFLRINETEEGITAFAEIPSDEYLKEELVKEIINDIRTNLNGDEAVDCNWALTEAINNALYHGNLGLKDIRDIEERKRRLADSELQNKKILMNYFRSGNYLVFSITDEGQGFDYSRYLSEGPKVKKGQYNGIGLKTIMVTMDEICFNEKGNSITMVKKFK